MEMNYIPNKTIQTMFFEVASGRQVADFLRQLNYESPYKFNKAIATAYASKLVAEFWMYELPKKEKYLTRNTLIERMFETIASSLEKDTFETLATQEEGLATSYASRKVYEYWKGVTNASTY